MLVVERYYNKRNVSLGLNIVDESAWKMKIEKQISINDELD